MGSLARGGFSELASDIDIGLILNGELQDNDSADIDDIKKALLKNHSTEKTAFPFSGETSPQLTVE